MKTGSICDALRYLIENAEEPVNAIATEAARVQPKNVGETPQAAQVRWKRVIQKALSRAQGHDDPRHMRQDSFDDLIAWTSRYDTNWAAFLQQAHDRAHWVSGFMRLTGLDTWLAPSSDKEMQALRESSHDGLNLPPFVKEHLFGTGRAGTESGGFVNDAREAGIPPEIVDAVLRRLLAPYCGSSRSEKKLLHWNDLTVPARKRAFLASLIVERTWLGLPVGARDTLRSRAIPIKDRIPPPPADG